MVPVVEEELAEGDDMCQGLWRASVRTVLVGGTTTMAASYYYDYDYGYDDDDDAPTTLLEGSSPPKNPNTTTTTSTAAAAAATTTTTTTTNSHNNKSHLLHYRTYRPSHWNSSNRDSSVTGSLKVRRPLPTRAEQLVRLQQSTAEAPMDVLVVGGGATGCGIALDAVTRGLSTGLI